METDKTLRLQDLYNQTLEAGAASDHRRISELSFEQDNLAAELSPSELHAHMVFLIAQISGANTDKIVDAIEARCGSRDPEVQNPFIEDALKQITEILEDDGFTSPLSPFEISGPSGMQ